MQKEQQLLEIFQIYKSIKMKGHPWDRMNEKSETRSSIQLVSWILSALIKVYKTRLKAKQNLLQPWGYDLLPKTHAPQNTVRAGNICDKESLVAFLRLLLPKVQYFSRVLNRETPLYTSTNAYISMRAIIPLLVSLSLYTIGHATSTVIQPSDDNLVQFVRTLNHCYDLDGSKNLDEHELLNLVRGTIDGHTSCPAQMLLDSQLVTSAHIQQLESFLGRPNISLEKLYSSDGSKCNFATLLAGVDGKSDILLVAKSSKGYLFGGYRKAACPIRAQIGDYWESMADRDAFVFSLTANVHYKANERNRDCCTNMCIGRLNRDVLLIWNAAVIVQLDDFGQCFAIISPMLTMRMICRADNSTESQAMNLFWLRWKCFRLNLTEQVAFGLAKILFGPRRNYLKYIYSQVMLLLNFFIVLKMI